MSDIEIARNAKLEPIAELAQRCLGLEKEQLIPYGHYKAKIDPQSIDEEPSSKLVLSLRFLLLQQEKERPPLPLVSVMD